MNSTEKSEPNKPFPPQVALIVTSHPSSGHLRQGDYSSWGGDDLQVGNTALVPRKGLLGQTVNGALRWQADSEKGLIRAFGRTAGNFRFTPEHRPAADFQFHLKVRTMGWMTEGAPPQWNPNPFPLVALSFPK